MDPARTHFKLSHYLPKSRPFNTRDIEFSRISTKADTCLPGDLYIAIVSAEGDGHDDIETAIENGASGILAERLLPTQSPLFVVDDTRTAFSRLTQIVNGTTVSGLATIAVTGTSGVSATAQLISHLLTTAGLDAPVVACPRDATPQEAFEAYSVALNNISERDGDYAIIQISPEQLASRFYDSFDFDYLVVTSIEIDGGEYDGTDQAYANSYRRAFDRLLPQGVAVLNFGDPVTRFDFLPEHRAFLSVGSNDESDIWVQHLEHDRNGQSFLIHAGDDSQEIFSPVLGHQHIFSSLQAVAVGLLLNLPFDQLCSALCNYTTSPGHLQRVSQQQEFDVYVDHANTARDLSKAVLALRQVTPGRLIVVYGASAIHSTQQRAALGQIAEKFADLSIITENNAEYEDPLQIAHDILDGYSHCSNAYVIPGRERAIAFGISRAEAGDAVLIAGKGDQKYDKIGSEILYLDDVKIAEICLGEFLNPVAKYGRDIFRFDDYAGG